MLQYARVTALSVFELLRKKQKEGGKILPTQIRVKDNSDNDHTQKILIHTFQKY